MKCLHGETKSSNKSFNEMIWAKIAKLHYVGLLKLEIGVYDAIAILNFGKQASLDFLI